MTAYGATRVVHGLTISVASSQKPGGSEGCYEDADGPQCQYIVIFDNTGSKPATVDMNSVRLIDTQGREFTTHAYFTSTLLDHPVVIQPGETVTDAPQIQGLLYGFRLPPTTQPDHLEIFGAQFAVPHDAPAQHQR